MAMAKLSFYFKNTQLSRLYVNILDNFFGDVYYPIKNGRLECCTPKYDYGEFNGQKYFPWAWK